MMPNAMPAQQITPPASATTLPRPTSKAPIVFALIGLASLGGVAFGAYRFLAKPSSVSGNNDGVATASASAVAVSPPATASAAAAVGARATSCPEGMALVP